MPMNARLLRPLASGFNPQSISGLAAWWDASDSSTLTLNGGNVSEWRDKSGNGRDATQPTSAIQPQYTLSGLAAKNVVTFDGGAKYLAFSAFGADQRKHLFVVASQLRRSGGDSYIGVVSSNFVSSQAVYLGTNTNIISNGFISSQATASGALRVNQDPKSSPSSTAWPSEVSLFTYTHAFATPQSIDYLGTYSGSLANRYMEGIIAEVLLYFGDMTASQISAVERYLMAKWGL